VWIKDEYGNPPLIVTENGFGDDGRLNDTGRIDYMNVRETTVGSVFRRLRRFQKYNRAARNIAAR